MIKKKHSTKKQNFICNTKTTETYYEPLLQKSKQNYYKKYFEPNWNNARFIWKSIRSSIKTKDITSSMPRTIS